VRWLTSEREASSSTGARRAGNPILARLGRRASRQPRM